MAEIVRRRSWGGVLPLGRHASSSGSSLIQCASVSIALSSFQEGQNARQHKQFKLEQALIRAAKNEIVRRDDCPVDELNTIVRELKLAITNLEKKHDGINTAV